MKSIKKSLFLPLIALLFTSTILYGQDTTKCLTRAQIDLDNQAYYDALTYRPLVESLIPSLDTAQAFIIKQQAVIHQGQVTIKAKDEHVAFEKSKGDMLAKDVRKLETNNFFWRIYSGIITAVAGVLIIKNL
jgi:hypothetical protein